MCSKYDIYVPTQKPTHNYFEGFFFPPRALFSMTNSHKSKMSISDFVESQDTAMIDPKGPVGLMAVTDLPQ